MAAEPSEISITLDPTDSGESRVAVWRDVMRLVGEIEVPDPAKFAARFVSKNLGDIRTVCVVASTYCVKRDRTGTPMPREHVILNLVEQGTMKGRIAGKAVAIKAGDIVLSRTSSSLDLVLDEASWMGILIPRTVAERKFQWKPRHDGAVLRAGTAHGALLAGLVRSLCAMPDALSSREGTRATSASLTLIAACISGTAAGPRDRVDEREGTARAIRRFIVRHLGDPALGVGLIVKEFGLSRSAVYRIMGETGDLATIIRSLRLQAVARELALAKRTDEALTILARRWGFTDERSFRRAFSREFGHSPSALRGNAAADQILGPVSSDLQRWFLGV